MFENQWERHELVGIREFFRYPPVQNVKLDFLTLFPHREDLSGTFLPISGSRFSSKALISEAKFRIIQKLTSGLTFSPQIRFTCLFPSISGIIALAVKSWKVNSPKSGISSLRTGT